ncbi:MAG: class II aldolase/adducin family protein [Propionivibrio sp.]
MPYLRQQLIDAAIRVAERGLNNGTSGNLSVRTIENGEPGFLITPTSAPYQDLKPEDIVFIDMNGAFDGLHNNRLKPSTEWRFHLDIYRAYPAAGAVLHAHSRFASSLSCLRRDIPAFHYMIALFGGDTLRCAEYATFGTQALSDNALRAMHDRNACLLANHGMLVFGRDLAHAEYLGTELELLCEQYWRACQLGQPFILDRQEMAVILEKFGFGYSKRADA